MPRRKKMTVKSNDLYPNFMDSVRSSRAWDLEGKSFHRSDQVVSASPANVIRNQFFSRDGIDPVESLQSLQEIFKGKLERDVVQLVFTECTYNVEQALETLFSLMPETESKVKCEDDWMAQPTASSVAAPDNPLTLRGGGNDNVGLKHVYTYAGTKKSAAWNTISVSSDSSSDCASMKDYGRSDPKTDRAKSKHQHYADVIYHKSEMDRSGSANPISRASSVIPPNLAATGFTFSVNSDDLKSVDSIFSSKNAIEDTIMLIHSKERMLIILRGLPGSGKSLLAKKLNINGIVFSTDDYFMNNNNEYKFEPNLLMEAHEWNKARTFSALEDYVSPVIIDNTNIEACHIKPYVMLGIKFKYKIAILEPDTLWKFNVSELARRNQHGVSKKSISRMLERYEHGITVESFGLGYAKNNNFGNYIVKVSGAEQTNSSSAEASSRVATPERSMPSEGNLAPDQKAIGRSKTPEFKSKISDSSSKTSLSSDNVENSSTSSQTSDGLKSASNLRLDLKDFMALAQQESEDSLSVSRRTSASSSQDTSGWEYDEEFQWSSDDNRLHGRSHLASSAGHVSKDLILEGKETGPDKSKLYAKGNHGNDRQNSPFQWTLVSPKLNLKAKPSLPSDWSMPSYPIAEDVVCNKLPCLNISIPIPVHAFSQTSSEDFLQLHSVNKVNTNVGKGTTLKVLVGHSNICISVYTSIKPIQMQAVPISPVFDKSTTTEDLENGSIDRENKISLLQSMFPSISILDLEDILDKCHNDQDWAVNLLIDFGLEFNNVDCKLNPAKLPVSENIASADQVVTKTILSENVTGEVCVTDCSDVNMTPAENNRLADISCDSLVLSLEPAFIMQLEEMFGTPGFHIGLDGISTDDLQVSLSRDLAKGIYSLWKGTLEKKTTGTPTSSDCQALPSQGGSSDVQSLADIMAMEQALEVKRQEMLKRQNKNADALATKLGRLKLYGMFPGIDRTALDEMYQANNYKLSLTLLSLQEALGDGPNGKAWLHPDFLTNAEEELHGMACEASLEGQFEMDWRNWVADIPNEDDLLPPEDYQAVAGFEDIRAEATLHYRKQRECYQKSNDAYRRGMKAVASFYSQQGNLHGVKLKEANERAAEKILEIRNTSLDPSSLDLHGLYVSEALVALQHFLRKKSQELQKCPLNRLTLAIITGRGAHSSNQVARLKPAVHDFLLKENYKFEAVQDGLFKVTLT